MLIEALSESIDERRRALVDRLGEQETIAADLALLTVSADSSVASSLVDPLPAGAARVDDHASLVDLVIMFVVQRDEMAERWAEHGFVRIHRSVLVALPHVEEVRSEGGRVSVVIGGVGTLAVVGLLVIVSLRNGFGIEPWPIIGALGARWICFISRKRRRAPRARAAATNRASSDRPIPRPRQSESTT